MRRLPAVPLRAALDALADGGLLLKQDKDLPSVVGIVTGESVRASWWSHPQASRIFSVLCDLADHPDVLVAKLLCRKDTLVHRRLWPALLAVAAAREPWQTRGLSPAARRLLREVDGSAEPLRRAGAAAKELLLRLLVTAREVHTDSGRHALALESWRAWSARVRCRPASSVEAARRVLERAAAGLGSPRPALPWPGGGREPS